MRNYPRLSIEEFGQHLLTTGDLDPVYIALHKAELPRPELARVLVAYWCFYHLGFAAYAAGGPPSEFWDILLTAAQNDQPAPTGGRWPRGHERRHFRGFQGTDAVRCLRGRYPEGPLGLLERLTFRDAVSFKIVNDVAQAERGFGPWIAFKIADMLDRLDIQKVDFSEAEVFMFKDPREAALRLWRMKMGMSEHAMPRDVPGTIHEVVEYLKKEFKEYLAPPLYDRAASLAEIETCLCKWKSHMNGHYPLFNDTIEINEGLEQWAPHSEIAVYLRSYMPKSAPPVTS